MSIYSLLFQDFSLELTTKTEKMLKFNDENVTALEMNEDPNEYNQRKQDNLKEIHRIEKNINSKQKDPEDQKEDKEKEKPTNQLDASGHIHSNIKQDRKENDKEFFLPEPNSLHSKFQTMDTNEPFIDQWNSNQMAPNQRNSTQNMVENDCLPPKSTEARPMHPNLLNLHQKNHLEANSMPIRSSEPNTTGNYNPNTSFNDPRVDYQQNSNDTDLPRESREFEFLFDSAMTNFMKVFNTSDDSPSSSKSKLKQPLPLKPVLPEELVYNLQLKAIKYIIVAGLICYLVGRFHFGITIGILMPAMFVWGYWNLGACARDGVEWQLEKSNSIQSLYKSEGETVEWLNYMFEKIWRSVDPEVFAIVEDLLEDTIQSISPSIIKSVKISDFDLGIQAPRIQMIRIFPPLPGQPEESIFGEAAFSFHSHPIASLVTNRGPKSTPPGLTIQFQTGLSVPIDVKAELVAVTGKIRFKLLTCPEIPFLSKATIAFTSVPHIETGVMPVSKHLNIMNLPTIKSLVNEGVKLGFADLVDPKSMTIDIRALMGAFSRDTEAIGVVKVEVRGAKREASRQLKDMKDSYATVSLSSQPKKTISSTRVLTNDKDPQWNENLYVLVYKDDIIADSKIDVKVWDADKIKFDDMWGCISMSVKDVTQATVNKLGNVSNYSHEERVVFDGWAPIDGKDESHSKIKINMKMSFHPKYPTADMDIFSGEAIKKKKEESESNKKALETPVLPEHNNGILYIQIHQAMDLEIGDPGILPTSDEFQHPYNPNKIVSPYAVIYINDNKVYQTRSKFRNPSPHWNAITEQFIRNVDTSFVRISVKNSVDLERDPVLGTKVLHLKDLFSDQDDKFKESQQWLPLSNGIGFGKVLVTFKYKPICLTLPRELQGCDVGTLVIERLSLTNLKSPYAQDSIKSTKAILSLNIDPPILKRLKSKKIGQEIEDIGPYGWYDQNLYYPLTMRYRSAVYIHIIQGSLSTVKSTGRFWLDSIVDNEWHEITVGLHSFVNKVTSESNKNENPWPEEGEFGQVKLRVKIVPGFSPVHTHLKSFAKDFVGADPFYDKTMEFKAKKWVKDHNEKVAEGKGDEDDDLPHDYDLQSAIKDEQSKMDPKTKERESATFDGTRRVSELSSEYGDETSEEDEDLNVDMFGQKKKSKISKHRVVRKMSWSVDKFIGKVDSLREGFNSESRASRTIAKEI